MKKLLVLTTALIAFGGAAANASSLNVAIGTGYPVYAAPAYVAPAPVVVEPAPVYPEYIGGYYHVRPHAGYYPRHREYDWNYWHDHHR